MRMVTIIDAIRELERFAPPETAAEYDNPGLKTGDASSELTGILITVDTNENVVAEAVAKGCNLIIEHHPSIWKPLRAFDINIPLNRAIMSAIKNDIALYSAHTNVDFADGGLNDYVAAKMNLNNVSAIDGPQSARLGYLSEATTLKEYAKIVSKIFDDDNIITVGNLSKKIKSVAVINGAGGNEHDLLATYKAGADVFVTSEVKYNVTRLAKDLDYAIIQVGHFESEECFLPLVASVLKNKLSEVPIHCAETISSTYNRRDEIWN